MTFQQLQYLLEVYRTGSVSQAAENLFVAQSSVSTAVSNLEKELNCSIFIRSKRGLIPTAQGAGIIEHANRICESHRIMTTQESQARKLRICSTNFEPAHNAFFRLVKENADRRDIHFSLASYEQSPAKLLKFFDLELALLLVFAPRLFSTEAHFKKNGLHFDVLGSVPAAIRIGLGHRFFDKPDVSPSDFINDYFLDIPGNEISSILVRGGIMQIDSRNTIIANHFPLRKKLLADGIAYDVTHILPKQQTLQNDVRYIPLDGFCYKLCIATNPLCPTTPEIERFQELLNEELSDFGIL